MFAAGSRRANWDDNDEKNCLAMRNTMRAIVVADKNRAGVGTVETPTPSADEIRVRVKAAALNRADLLVLAGHQHGSVGGAGAILGLECAGEVESLGQGVTGVESATASCFRPPTPSPNMRSPTPAARRKFRRA